MNIHSLIQLIVVLEECDSPGAVVEELEKVILAGEFEYYGLLRYPRQGIDPRGITLASRWPDKWLQAYATKKYLSLIHI